jgi:hypothetical protein
MSKMTLLSKYSYTFILLKTKKKKNTKSTHAIDPKLQIAHYEIKKFKGLQGMQKNNILVIIVKILDEFC